MLKVQQFLRSGRTLSDLQKEFGVYTSVQEDLGLAIANYCQIESSGSLKRNPIVQECRALTLELDTWEVIGRSFPRFYNSGECPDVERAFDWNSGVAAVKEDGSLIVVYAHRGEVRVNTRGSFADKPIGEGCPTWRDAFKSAVPNWSILEEFVLKHPVSLSFEFCSRFNRVVRDYPTPTTYLLAGFHTKSGQELSSALLDIWAKNFGVSRPEEFSVSSLPDVLESLDKVTEATFEGFVVRDKTGMRLKCKRKEYLALHRLKDNGNLFAVKNLVPLVLGGELDEVLTHFPEATEKTFEVTEKLGGARARLEAVWAKARGLGSQKEFAIFVNKHTPLSSILFRCRKEGKEPADVWKESEDLLLKVLF